MFRNNNVIFKKIKEKEETYIKKDSSTSKTHKKGLIVQRFSPIFCFPIPIYSSTRPPSVHTTLHELSPRLFLSFPPLLSLSLPLTPCLLMVLCIARYTVTTEVSTPLKYAHVGKLTNWLFHTKGHAPFDIPSLSRGSME